MSLKTKDEREAVRRLPHVVAQLLAERERLQRTAEGTLKAEPMSPAEWAKWWRGVVIDRGGDPDRGRIPEGLEDELDMEVERRLGREVGEDEDESGAVRPTYEPDAEQDALELAALARGKRSLIGAELDRYLDERKLKARYASRSKRAVKELVAWRRLRAGGDDLKRIDRREAGMFVDHLRSRGLATATANSLVSSLLSYWDWMERRGAAQANPWARQTIRPTEDEAEREVRPFTDKEAVKLLSGKTSRTLHDLMRFSALAGTRINEIANLRVSDIEGDLLYIRKAKTHLNYGQRHEPLQVVPP